MNFDAIIRTISQQQNIFSSTHEKIDETLFFGRSDTVFPKERADISSNLHCSARMLALRKENSEIWRKFDLMALKRIQSRNLFFRILSHFIFWACSLVFFSVLIFYTRDFRLSAMDLKTAINILTTISILAISVYINLLWLLPGFFAKRKFFLFGVLEILNIALFITLNYFSSMAFEGKISNFFSEMVAEFILVSLFLIITTLIKFTRDSIALQDAELKIKEVERQNIESELRALKAQFNPHFFFNTLNSIYALSLDRSEKVPELILKLSDLMRYVLYDTRDDKIPMSKQLSFLESYIYLERLRAVEGRNIEFNVVGENTGTCIAPLLFEPFVENAFKHGAREKQNHPYISIRIDLTRKKEIVFTISNNKDPERSNTNNLDVAKGIGLTNVRKRLELLYPGKYNLKLTETRDEFNVELTIETNENQMPHN